MSDRSRMIIEALGHWLLAWVLVVLAVSLWAAILRPRRATVRYVGWLLATFAGAALLPGVVAIGPRISWREILPRSRPVVRPSTLERPTFSLRSWFEDLPRAPKPVLSSRQENPSNDDPIKTAMHDRTIQSPALPVGSAPHAAGDRWPTLGVILWLAGFLVFAARLIGSAFRVRAMLASLDLAVSDDLNRHMDRIRTDLGIRRRVRIASHSDLLAPMCMGLLRPMILWPRAENCPMNPRQQLASLTHELAHFRHGDDWIALFAEIWRALTWFFLPVHIALRFLNREREYRCDDLAATALESPEDYARWLLDLAPMSVGPSPPLVAASLLGRTSLMERIADRSRRSLSVASATGTSALAELDHRGDPVTRRGRVGAADRLHRPRPCRRASRYPPAADDSQAVGRPDSRSLEALRRPGSLRDRFRRDPGHKLEVRIQRGQRGRSGADPRQLSRSGPICQQWSAMARRVRRDEAL